MILIEILIWTAYLYVYDLLYVGFSSLSCDSYKSQNFSQILLDSVELFLQSQSLQKQKQGRMIVETHLSLPIILHVELSS